MNAMLTPARSFMLGALLSAVLIALVTAEAQDTLSAQVLRLLDRVNTWTVAQTFAVDIQITTVNTAAPAGTLCDVAGEVGKVYFDSTGDVLWLCSGASGWRQISTSAP